MTREEAIAILQEKYDYCKSFYDLAARPKEDYAETAQYLQALQVALTALRGLTREQVEKMRGEWQWQGPCRDNQGRSWETCSVCDARQRLGDYGAFCPACGSPMIDKAVDILWNRLEAMQDEAETV